MSIERAAAQRVDAGAAPEGEVQPDAPELSARTLSMFVLQYEKVRGRARLEALWRERGLPLSPAYLRNLNNFVSLRFTERLVEVLASDSGDPQFVRKAGRLASKPEALGFPYYLLKAIGSPRLIFSKVVELGPAYNRVSTVSLEKLTRTEAVLVYRSHVPERGRWLCEARREQFASFTTVCGLPPAEAHEIECQLDGATACKYLFRWRTPPVRLGLPIGLVLGLVLGGALGLEHLATWLAGLGLGGVLGAAAGLVRDSRAELEAKNHVLEEQGDALTRSIEDLQARYAELHQLNLELEDHVQQRTRELAASNRSLEQALVKARELDRLKTEFFDNVSHELRTPLALILLSLESLQHRDDGEDPQSFDAHLETIERSASRLLRLINQLLDIAKLEAGKTRLRYERVDVRALLDGVLRPFEQLAREHGIELSVEGEASELVEVDPEKIEVVFHNLVSNALKFTPGGGRVAVRVRQRERAIEVDVEDSGVGISRQVLPAIFDRFAQADAKGIKRFGGTGIGLALVRETVEIHGGTLSVSSEEGRGSCFTVSLPLGTGHIHEELREKPGPELPQGQERRALGGVLEALHPGRDRPIADDNARVPEDAPRILVVEDDPDLRRVIANALRTRYRVVEANDGVEGEERALELPPDLIVSDLMMPRRSGLQLLERLRALPATAEVPLILLTARRETDAVVRGLNTGANDYLGKPFATRELLARVEAQLRLREAALRSATAERLSALGLLTSGFAHEVRNPLNGMLNAVEPLRQCLGDPASQQDARVLLDVIRDCGQRVQGLAESLLGFARPATGEGQVDLAASLESTVAVLRWRFSPEVKLVTDLRFRGTVRGDAAGLGQVWLNFLDNALRAVGSAGVVTVATERVGERVRVSVRDTGPGITEEVRAKLFEPFFSTRPAGEGTGLGLALCRRIVLAHGGKISVESTPGQGATFSVELPVDAEPPQGT